MFRLLLDENLPKKLKYRFGDGFDIITVPEQGGSSLKNGQLLQKMSETDIQYLVTADKNLSFQQNYAKFNVKLIVINTPDLQYETVLPFITKIKALFEQNDIQYYNWIEL